MPAKQHTKIVIPVESQPSRKDPIRPATTTDYGDRMTTLRDSNVHDDAASLRAAMVSELREDAITSEPVARARATVPRHLFTPGEPLETAYAPHNTPIVKRDDNGLTLSSVSAAHLQAVMLEQAEIEPGMRICEVGSGGYNAALVRHEAPPFSCGDERSPPSSCRSRLTKLRAV